MEVRAEARDAGKRLDSFLHERLPEFSRSRLQSWIKEGRVRIADETVRASQILRGREVVTVEPAAPQPLRAEAEELPLEILYEDDDVVVVNKAAGVVVHAGAGHPRGTLVNALLHHFGALSTVNGDLRPGIVHRLDRETSGVLVVARTDGAHQSLARQFHEREVEKSYLALVHGRMKQREGRITSPIARDPERRTRMTAKLSSGRAALTDYKLLEQFERLSYLAVRIGTGRTHQIRVHLASIRHPIVGDRLYGAPASSLGRFFLHAHRLRFRSPSTGDWIQVESPLPEELSRFLESLRINTDRMVAS
ncbi:MAG TPA: RluA family pseudouridine synthase [Bryobacteraceae bacterium]|nr:RluA family pseudouridine synthase [Bryobacteraceae bacterium]